MKRFVLFVLSLAVLPDLASAYTGQKPVTGTVMAISSNTVMVHTLDGKYAVVELAASTRLVEGTKSISTKDLMIGEDVVIQTKEQNGQIVATKIKVSIPKHPA